MKEKISKLKKNRTFNIIEKVLSILITIFIIAMLSVVLVQRLSGNKFNLGGYGVYTVATGSMIPKYDVKDIILTHKVDPSKINIDDDIVYQGKKESVAGKIITHRVINKKYENGKYLFTTKGINNGISDPEIDETQVLGVVKCKLHLLSFCSHIINNSYGFMFLIFIPFVVFVFFEARNIYSEIKDEKKRDGA